jgi:AcrR family transcriptional regulator
VPPETSRPRPRRRDTGPRKGDLREAQILDAGEALLRRIPYADLTIDEIATEAGMSRSTLYFYFASKEALLAALHERTHSVMAEPVALLRARGGGTYDSMRAAVALTAKIWREHTHALRTFHQVATSSEEFGERWRTNLSSHVSFLTELIETERARNRSLPSTPDARSIASAWFWMLEGRFYDLHGTPHTRADEKRLIDTLTILWLRCVGLPETRTTSAGAAEAR